MAEKTPTYLQMRYMYLQKYLTDIEQIINDKIVTDRQNIANNRTVFKDGTGLLERGAVFVLESMPLLMTFVDEQKYAKYFNNSSLLYVFSVFEGDIIDIAKLVKERTATRLSYTDIYDNGDLQKVKKYIEQHIGISLKTLEKEWTIIKEYQTIRNRIAHNHSSLEGLDNKKIHLINYMKRDGRIEYNPQTGAFYIKDISYIVDFCQVALRYISALDELTSKVSSKLSDK